MRQANPIKSNRYYEPALICLNGHILNIFGESKPEHNSEYCPRCGEATVSRCPNCGALIRGCYHVRDENGWLGSWDRCTEKKYHLPLHCHHCGAPYPWTAARLETAAQLINSLPDLPAQKKQELTAQLNDLLQETPRTALTTLIFHNALQTAPPIVAAGLREIILPNAAPIVQRLLCDEQEKK